ncbi:unnamed protein product, partial [Oppiella nova]
TSSSNPFSQNNSVPFAPTFRAPSPDFSGFNISRYGELAPSSKLSALRPVPLGKPIVPINKHPNTVYTDRVNIPLRYRLKGQSADGVMYGPLASGQSSIGDKYGSDTSYTDDREGEWMLAVERGSQSAESQSSHTVVNVSQQDFNRYNNNLKSRRNESQVYGKRTKPIPQTPVPSQPPPSQPTTQHNIAVAVDESPLQKELEVSPKTPPVGSAIGHIPALTKEQLKNRTDHTILNDVMRLIAQNAPAIAPTVSYRSLRHAPVVHDISVINSRAKRNTHYDSHSHHKDYHYDHYKGYRSPASDDSYRARLLFPFA